MKLVINGCDGATVRLRLLREDDLPHTLAWRNRDDVRKWFKHSEVLTVQQHEAWFARYLVKGDDFTFIAENEHGERVGQVAIYGIEHDLDEAEVGRFIAAPEHAGKGYMRAAIELLAKLAFRGMHLRKIWLEVMQDNERAIRLYDGCGFVYEGHEGIPDENLVLMERSA